MVMSSLSWKSNPDSGFPVPWFRSIRLQLKSYCDFLLTELRIEKQSSQETISLVTFVVSGSVWSGPILQGVCQTFPWHGEGPVWRARAFPRALITCAGDSCLCCALGIVRYGDSICRQMVWVSSGRCSRSVCWPSGSSVLLDKKKKERTTTNLNRTDSPCSSNKEWREEDGGAAETFL